MRMSEVLVIVVKFDPLRGTSAPGPDACQLAAI
jgi:hypothetical protein